LVPGRVPFIKCGAFVVAELDPIISFVNHKVNKVRAKLKKWVQFCYSPMPPSHFHDPLVGISLSAKCPMPILTTAVLPFNAFYF
jgi:hypothetical protein